MASQLSGRVLRDCHVASLLAMTRQESARCTSALARLNCPPRGAQGTPLHFPSGPFRVFCAKKIPEAQASGNFSLSKKSLWAFSPSCFQNCKIEFCCILFCNSTAAAGDWTRKDTLTVSFHTFLPSEAFGWADYRQSRRAAGRRPPAFVRAALFFPKFLLYNSFRAKELL